MEVVEYKKMEDFEQHYWWHKGKLRLIEALYDKFVPSEIKNKKVKILEVGCGTGEVLKLLSRWGDVKGIDISKEALDACRRKGFKNLVQGDINELNLRNEYGSYDLVICLDVLEHVQEDLSALKEMNKLLRPGGILMLTVPAYKFLWSTHDEALHHKRRYHSLEIKTKVRDAGFQILKHTHYVTVLFFPIAAVRLLNNFVRRTPYPKTHYLPLPKSINSFFIKILDWEATIVKYFYLPMGTTMALVAKNVARKNRRKK
jgi:2-polyprenyl-3-methyl-5-hydroxy-6-metoxy-1,4-benzoquinol methylase